jgi:hypothetical protein
MTANAQLDRIERAIIGDGREGLLAQTARIEERVKAVASTAENAKLEAEKATEAAQKGFLRTYEAINALTLNVNKLTTSVDTHHKSVHFYDLLKRPKFWTFLIVGFIILHFVSTYVPVVWDGVMIMVGLPHLAIPVK